MRYTTRTEYGLICMSHLARMPDDQWVALSEIANEEHYPVPYIEKILQSLKHAGLLASQTGSQGGYKLARPAAEITIKAIIEALEGSTFDIFCEPLVREDIVCNHICLCGVKPVWKKTRDLLDHFYDSITLEMLAKSPAEVQHLMSSEARMK